MDKRISVSSSSSTGSLLSSVLKELKRKRKKTPPVITVMDVETMHKKTPSIDKDEKLNGTADDQSIVKKDSELPPSKKPSPSLSNRPQKPLVSPPIKPKRLKKLSTCSIEADCSENISTVNSSNLPSDFRSLLDNAFTDPVMTMSFSDGSKQCSPERPYSEQYEQCNGELPTDDAEQCDRDQVKTELFPRDTLSNSISIDSVNDRHGFDSQSYDTVSMFSALSDDGLENDWLDNDMKRGSFDDSLSVSSMSIEGKKIKKRNAKAKAKMLKKQAAVQKERVGAFLDAATANASDRIKKIRRGSIKIPIGKGKFQNITNRINQNKQLDHGKSGLKTVYASGSDSDDPSKFLSSHDKTMTPPYGRSKSKNDRQMGIRSGYLKKQGAKMKNWSERWFVLQSDCLNYYKEPNGKLLGSIHLTGCKVAISQTRPAEVNKFTFEIIPGSEQPKINNNHESYLLSTTSQIDMEDWMKAIKRVIFSPFGGGIFGQKLDDTLSIDRRRASVSSISKNTSSSRSLQRLVPIIVENCIEFIRCNKGMVEEGLFRLPGQSNEVKDLQDAYDKGERPVFPKTTDIHTVASLLKGYVRELPEPIIPFEQYENLITASKLSQTESATPQPEGDPCPTKEKEEARRLMKDQVDLLPQSNYNLLRYLCQFLFEVQQHSDLNKMDASNLALVFGPNIMKAKEESAIAMMADTTHVQHVMFSFITDHKYFFPCEKLSLPTQSSEDLHLNGDAGIGTMTTTGSPQGTLRMAADDSGTGSLDATPENTQKRAPNLPSVPPPTRRPIKPKRKPSNLSVDTDNAQSLNTSNQDRKSIYDNVTLTPPGNDVDTFSNLSVSAVAGSIENLDSPPPNSSPGDFRQRVSPVMSANRVRSSSRDDLSDSTGLQNQRSNPTTVKEQRSFKPISQRRVGGEVAARIERLSIGSTSDESSMASKAHRKFKKNDGNLSSSSQRSSKTDVEPYEHVSDLPSVVENQSNGSSPNINSRPPTYKELESQVRFLKEELHKQRLEHEKRSKMLEEHYVMKMKSYPPPSSASGANFVTSPTNSSQSFDLMNDGVDQSVTGAHSVSGRTMSVESQADSRYKDEVKRHQITKIKLRNTERGLKQAEERNRQLQKEMEEFFNTFGVDGGMLEQSAS